MASGKNYYVYILTNWNNKVMYIGVTNSLERRVYEHKNKLIKGFERGVGLRFLASLEMTNMADRLFLAVLEMTKVLK